MRQLQAEQNQKNEHKPNFHYDQLCIYTTTNYDSAKQTIAQKRTAPHDDNINTYTKNSLNHAEACSTRRDHDKVEQGKAEGKIRFFPKKIERGKEKSIW